MEITNYLDSVFTDGQTKGLFEIVEINQLPNSCCTRSTTQVIDFDKVKDKIVASSNIHTIKSCDGLKILADQKRIDFIEFKGFKPFVQNTLSQYKSVDRLQNKFERQIVKYDLRGKIEDSLFLWEQLIRSRDFTWNNETRKAARSIKKNYIILTDIDVKENAIEFITLNLTFLGQFSTPIENLIETRLQKEIDDMPTDLSLNLAQPRLKNCNEIDKYYSL